MYTYMFIQIDKNLEIDAKVTERSISFDIVCT